MEKILGKIAKVKLGRGGYDDAMYGVTFQFSMNGSGVSDFKGNWYEYPKGAEYTKEKWENSHKEAYEFLKKVMTEAKVSDFKDLAGIPVEIMFDGNVMRSWRVLTEVL